jgi:RNA polymerase sigma-70 factor (ECF subfamily)
VTSGSTLPRERNEELVALAIKGDGDAFGQLYTRYLDSIYRYVYFRVGDEAEAEDLTEEVFIRAWEALPGYKVREFPFTSWLYRIAHNLIVDYHRRSKAGPLINVDDIPEISGSQSPERLLEDAQTQHKLAEAIRQLSDDEQQVIVLRYIEGLSHDEVAAAIGKSNEASRVIQHRALARLQGLLKR